MRETAQEGCHGESSTSIHKPIPAGEKAPSTFQDALKQGWTVISDKSHQSINQRRREGTLAMQKPGDTRMLEVDYIGIVKGYRFSVPKFAEDLP